MIDVLDPPTFLSEVVNKAAGRGIATAYCFGCHGKEDFHLSVYSGGKIVVYGLGRGRGAAAAFQLLERALGHLCLEYRDEYVDKSGGRARQLTFQVPG